MLLQFFLLFFGFFLLYIGAEVLVRGSSSLALIYGIKKLIIASTLIAVGTSAPEFFITFISSFDKTGDIGIGNIIGSNISNILLVFGLAIIFGKISVNSQLNKLDIPIMLIETLLLLPIIKDYRITRFEGFLLLIPFIIYILFLIFLRKEKSNIHLETKKESRIKLVILVLLGIFLLYFGAKVSIKSGIKIANFFGISPLIIGLSLIAVGSSLPELFTSLVASIKKEPDISFGNVVGSNIFNIGFAIGITAIVKPFSFTDKFVSQNLYCLLVVSFLLSILTFFNRNKNFPKIIGIFFNLSFFSYIFYLYFFVKG